MNRSILIINFKSHNLGIPRAIFECGRTFNPSNRKCQPQLLADFQYPSISIAAVHFTAFYFQLIIPWLASNSSRRPAPKTQQIAFYTDAVALKRNWTEAIMKIDFERNRCDGVPQRINIEIRKSIAPDNGK